MADQNQDKSGEAAENVNQQPQQPVNKSKMTDEERQALIKKLDDDLDDYLKDKIGKKKSNNDDVDIDALAEELLQHPLFIKEVDPTKPLPPLVEGLQAIMYESDDTEDNADHFREDGNRSFKYKKYRWAIDNYTEGIKCRCKNPELNAILYTNRAAAHYHIGNFRSSVKDCIFARKFKPDHFKAIFRGAMCFTELKQYENAMKWCDSGLLMNSTDEKLLAMRSKANKLKKAQERDQRKQQAKERKEQEAERRLIKVIKERGVKLASVKVSDDQETDDLQILSSLETHHPSGAKVFADENGALSWPVLFLYPEYGETDFISGFHEQSRFEQHLDAMFGPSADTAPWDAEKKYKPNKIQIFFEDTKTESLNEVKKESTLASVLKHDKYVVRGGMPAFILLVEGPFKKEFMKKYK